MDNRIEVDLENLAIATRQRGHLNICAATIAGGLYCSIVNQQEDNACCNIQK
jgi:hypothetical protein